MSTSDPPETSQIPIPNDTNDTKALCQLLLSRLEPTEDKKDGSIVIDSDSIQKIKDLIQNIQDDERNDDGANNDGGSSRSSSTLSSEGLQHKSRNKHRRKMSAFDHDKEGDERNLQIGYDLDDSTVKHVQHFTGMIEQDGVRHSSAHVIARLKHAVKHVVVINALKHIGSKHMMRLLQEQQEEGSHVLHRDLDNIDEWGSFNIFQLLKTFEFDRHLTIRSMAIEILETRHHLMSQLGVNCGTMLNYLNRMCDLYNDVPYHNVMHGGDVMQVSI